MTASSNTVARALLLAWQTQRVEDTVPSQRPFTLPLLSGSARSTERQYTQLIRALAACAGPESPLLAAVGRGERMSLVELSDPGNVASLEQAVDDAGVAHDPDVAAAAANLLDALAARSRPLVGRRNSQLAGRTRIAAPLRRRARSMTLEELEALDRKLAPRNAKRKES